MTSIDLESELTCAICTEVLYQPLTLLDCLHTFCGSCAKEWFAWQSERPKHERPHTVRSRPQRPKYSCPTCRARVRECRPNATVTTLLEMFLKANPDKIKKATEQREISNAYRPGDEVLQNSNGYARRYSNSIGGNITQTYTDVTDPPQSFEESLSRERDTLEMVTNATSELSLATAAEEPGVVSEAAEGAGLEPSAGPDDRERQHVNSDQRSLRSLISSSDLRSQDMTSKIMQQIIEQGLLTNIEPEQLTSRQEDELSNMIVDAYRRIRIARSHDIHDLQAASLTTDHGSVQHLAVDPTEAADTRPSSSSRLQTENETSTAWLSRRQDGSDGPSNFTPHHLDKSLPDDHQPCRSALPSSPRISDLWNRGQPTAQSTALHRRPALDAVSLRQEATVLPGTVVSLETQSLMPRAVAENRSVRATLQSDRRCTCCKEVIHLRTVFYKCYECSSCAVEFLLCLQCYRKGVGCHHWRGFEARTLTQGSYRADDGDPTIENATLHVLQPRKAYSEGSDGVKQAIFCDICSGTASSCYWQCDICNDGDWGFCQSCVSQAWHCTHPLLPLICAEPDSYTEPLPVVLSERKIRPKCNLCGCGIPAADSLYHCPSCNEGDYDVCSGCYHGQFLGNGMFSAVDRWRRCPQGHRMQVVKHERFSSGLRRVVSEDVVGGWEMRDNDIGSIGTIPLVHNGSSKWAWKDDVDGEWKHSQPFLPASDPISDSDCRAIAIWSRIPLESAKDELLFPRGAEIRNITNINGDWSWGRYCRKFALFPSNYTRCLN